MNVNGKTALITGGAHRVGRSIAMALAKAGANVAINYYSSSEAAERTTKDARKLGVGAMAVKADVSDFAQVNEMVSEVNAKFGQVDILVNSADLFALTPFPTDDMSKWHQVTGILINGAYYCSNAVAPKMLESGEGAIVNIVDLSAWEPWPDFSAHCVGKAALLALTRQLALELAPKVRANAIAPGPVLPPPDYGEEKIRKTAAKTLLDKWGTPEDVSKTAMFLIESDFITGELIVVDGGERYGHRKLEAG